jgi:methionine-rich copper-binding protein CopC
MRTFTIILSLLFVALGISGAQAHAFLDHASPRVGSTVPSAPRELTLSFTQNLEPAFTTVQVTGCVSASELWARALITCTGTHSRSIPIRRKAASLSTSAAPELLSEPR